MCWNLLWADHECYQQTGLLFRPNGKRPEQAYPAFQHATQEGHATSRDHRNSGLGLTQLEALARKLPAIVSRNCASVVRDGVDGILLPEPTPEAIVNALLACLHQPNQLATFSRNAMIRDEFTLESLGRSSLRLQKDLTGC
jgi:glycosyltransferase involved in cell wall biosynthesis